MLLALCVARAPAVPGDICRVTVCLLVDVRSGRDESDRDQHNKGGETPATVGLGGNVAIDVVCHGERI